VRNFDLTVEEREHAQNALAYLNRHWVAGRHDFLSDRTLEMVLGKGWEDDPEAIFELFIGMTRIAQILALIREDETGKKGAETMEGLGRILAQPPSEPHTDHGDRSNAQGP
jgi:hypothetical protein